MLQREFGLRISGFSCASVKRFGLASLVVAGLVLAVTPAEAEVLTFDEQVSRSLLASYVVRLTEGDVKLNRNDILR